MDMDGLQRSVTSFRRQGSSGLVWDDRFLSGELNHGKPRDDHHQDEESTESRAPQTRRSRSNRDNTYGAAKEISPAIDPPSPKVSGCGLCAVFGKPGKTRKLKSSRRKS
ncbi:hypothetical protein U1Q18_018255 [Sarracenia purpurea var. burkii]